MKLHALPRVLAWAFLTGFLIDLLRRCWIVEAWSIAFIALPLFLLAARATLRGSRDFLRQRRAPALPATLCRDDTH